MENLPPIAQLKTNWEDITEKVAKAASRSGRKPEDITVIAVTKTHPPEMIELAIEAGITVFGENYAREFQEKFDYISLKRLISQDGSLIEPQWHFIGHLQTNKVKYLVPFVSMIHSVDSVHLAEEISLQAIKQQRIINILLQVNTSGELSKSGCEPEEVFELARVVKNIENLRIQGLMTIGSFSTDETVSRREFAMLRKLRQELRKNFPEIDWKHLSMGMSGDFETAIEEGSTMVRIGTAIFGSRG